MRNKQRQQSVQPYNRTTSEDTLALRAPRLDLWKSAMTTLLLLCFFSTLQAQIYTVKAQPEEIERLLGLSAPIDIPSMDIAPPSKQEIKQLRIGDEKRIQTGGSPHIAIKVKAKISTSTDGVWVKSHDTNLWLLEIHSKGAKGLAPIFSQLDLSHGEIWIYTTDKKFLMGPINANNIPQNKRRSITDYLDGESFVIAYFSESRSNVNIEGLDYAYEEHGIGYHESEKCEIDATSREGNCFRFERQAVAVVLATDDHSTAAGTGTMINNTNQDLRPLLLTAAHLFDGSFFFEDTRIRFKWWSDRIVRRTIGPFWPFLHDEFDGHLTFTGTTFVAASLERADFQLLQVWGQILPEDEITYLGWSRVATPQVSTILHHPYGDLLKITQDGDPAVFSTSTVGWGLGYWQIGLRGPNDFGITEGGSSGAALLNEKHLICGQNRGGDASDCESNSRENKFYGRLDRSWDGDGDNQGLSRLSDHLDPRGGRVTELGATFQIGGNDEINPCGSQYVYSAPNIEVTTVPYNYSYRYAWHSSQNLRIVGNSTANTVTVVANNPMSDGQTEFVEADIYLDNKDCSGLLVGRARKTITWRSRFKILNRGSEISTVTYMRYGQSERFTAAFEGANSSTTYSWVVNQATGSPSYTGSGTFFDIYFLNNGSASVTVSATTYISATQTCTERRTFAVVATASGGGWRLINTQNGDIETWSLPSKDNLSSDIEQLGEANFIAYPNPIKSDKLAIKFLGDFLKFEEKEVFITDMNGKNVFYQRVTGSTVNLDVSDLLSGFYSITVKSTSGFITQKLVIQR